MPNRLDLHLLADLCQIGIGCRNRRNPGSRETDLGGRRKLIHHIRVSFFLTLHQNLDQIVLFILVEVMNSIGIIPVDPKILCCWIQFCKAVNRFIRVGDPLRIGILRHAPDSLDGRI